MQAAVAGPILGIDFLRKFKVTVVPEINKIQFACITAASPAPFFLQRLRRPSFAFSGLTSPAFATFAHTGNSPVPIQLPAATTSSQPHAISALVVRSPEVKSSSFSLREIQSLLDPPFSAKNS